jgi:hypothetical protein
VKRREARCSNWWYRRQTFLADRAHLDKLKAALAEHLGSPVTVKVSVGR